MPNVTSPQPQIAKTSAVQNAELNTPRVDGFKIKGSVKTSLKEVADALRTLSFLQVAQEREAINAVYVESRDIKKAPYLFSIIKIKTDEIELLYSIPREIAPKKRKMDIIRYLLNIISLVEQSYKVDNKVLYQLLENAVKEITDVMTLEYSKLYTEYDGIKKDMEDVKRKVSRLTEENQALLTKNYELKGKNDEMLLRIKSLETMTDEALKTKLQTWIAEHNGEINISEFSKTHNIIETKVEEILNRLVSEGYLEVIQ